MSINATVEATTTNIQDLFLVLIPTLVVGAIGTYVGSLINTRFSAIFGGAGALIGFIIGIALTLSSLG